MKKNEVHDVLDGFVIGGAIAFRYMGPLMIALTFVMMTFGWGQNYPILLAFGVTYWIVGEFIYRRATR